MVDRGSLQIGEAGLKTRPHESEVSPNPQNMLSSLPVEILEQIITYAGKDVSKLRRTCRVINAASLLVTWREVTITSGGVLENAFYRYLMDSEEPVELISRYLEYIRVVTVGLGLGYICDETEECDKVPEILRLIWQKGSGISRVNLELEQSLLQLDPSTYEWLHIITGPFQRSEPQVTTVDYNSEGGENFDWDYSSYFDDTRSTVQMIRQINPQFFNFELRVVDMALDLNFFRDVGKYIKLFEFEPDSRTIINFNDAVKHCTSLETLKLYLDRGRGPNAIRGGNYEYRLPDSVQTVRLSSGHRCLHTINGAQVSTLNFWGEGSARIRGAMPNLRVINIGEIMGKDPEAIECLKSLVAASRHLQKVSIGIVWANALAQIVEILDRVRISGLIFKDISDVDTIPDVSTKVMSRGRVQASIRPDDEGNTAHVWRCLALLLEKLPGMAELYFYTGSESSPLPEYTKKYMSSLCEVDLYRVKQHLLESSEYENAI
ncbi:hypothetical protein TRVA0_014S00606 [Trichomonascus vanleenenianus]|uniref:uncharacterized protein n=1 Tax=Trichomonascus vanleenenianus TaxID=2268995 RepID=UPI003EC97E72